MSDLIPPVKEGDIVSVEYLDQEGRFGDRVAKLGAFIIFVQQPIKDGSNRVQITSVKARSALAKSI